MDIDALSQALEDLVEHTDQSIIIDGHYGHELLNEKQVNLVVVLRKAPWALQTILQNRLYSYDKVWENLDAEIVGVITEEVQEQYPMEKLHEIDTTNKTPAETADEILQVFRGKRPKSFGPIDWITYPETLRVLVNRTCTLS